MPSARACRRLAHERRRFGYRRLAILLRREGVRMNLKKVYRREEGQGAARRLALTRPAPGHRLNRGVKASTRKSPCA